MALSTFTPPAVVHGFFSKNTSRQHKPRVLAAEFGDGYAQRAADGLNTDLAELKATWRNLTWAQARPMLDFFAARKGYLPFLFTLPGEAQARVFRAPEWGETFNEAGLVDVTATFNETAWPR